VGNSQAPLSVPQSVHSSSSSSSGSNGDTVVDDDSDKPVNNLAHNVLRMATPISYTGKRIRLPLSWLKYFLYTDDPCWCNMHNVYRNFQSHTTHSLLSIYCLPKNRSISRSVVCACCSTLHSCSYKMRLSYVFRLYRIHMQPKYLDSKSSVIVFILKIFIILNVPYSRRSNGYHSV